MESDRRFKQQTNKSSEDGYELEEYSVKRSQTFEDSDSDSDNSLDEDELGFEKDITSSNNLASEKKQIIDPYHDLIAGYEGDATNLLQNAIQGKYRLEDAQKLLSAFRSLEKDITQDQVPQMNRLRSYMNFDIALAHLNAHSVKLIKEEDRMSAEDFFERLKEIYDAYTKTIDDYLQPMDNQNQSSPNFKSTAKALSKATIDQYTELAEIINMYKSQVMEPKQIDGMVSEIKVREFLEKMQAALNKVGSSSFLDQPRSASKNKAPDDLNKFKHTILQEIGKNKPDIEKLSAIRVYLEEQQSLCKLVSKRDAPTFNMILKFLEGMPKFEENDNAKTITRSSPITIGKKK